ncbi:conserved hypothetical protein [Treponema phagedenis]|uniref:Uncharacterized protein n=1 Tax=Treponema phagedenis TaxID=162 RepID=A0A0B7GX11_TREPH|nr:hypothetical protein HMPREF9554_01586 [Treponema phagedenis F0421]CEM62107.1 conserved hypothetical protein [Treponema phagedenis]
MQIQYAYGKLLTVAPCQALFYNFFDLHTCIKNINTLSKKHCTSLQTKLYYLGFCL